MKKSVVVGLGFGDEGKGHVVNWLSSQDNNTKIIRYSGGHQVGHRVCNSEIEHVFSNFGSGTLQGATTEWRCCTVSPISFAKELKILQSKNVSPEIYIHPLTPITTPFDEYANIQIESEERNGSVGVGFGTTIQREIDNYHLYFADIFYDEILKEKMYNIERYYHSKNIAVTLSELNEFYNACNILKLSVITNNLFPLRYFNNIIYESSQGIMLDMEYGFFPNVTRSRIGTQNIQNEIDSSTDFYLVTRGYQTRHGNGYCTREEFYPNNPNERNVTSKWQREFRTRVLDVDFLRYAITIDPVISKSTNKNLVITCLDQMDYFPLKANGIVHFYNKNDRDEYINHIIKHLNIDFKSVYISDGEQKENIHKYL